MDKKDLQLFLIDSNKAGYASGENKRWLKEPDKSTTILFKKGLFQSHDNYFGGEPYGGRIVVFFDGKPIWMMVYYGWLEKGTSAESVYAVLRNALMRMPEDYPFRGPSEFREGEFVYLNSWEGELGRFHGDEKIICNGELLYKGKYAGGYVDQAVQGGR
jgi:hypothetical protein